MSNLEQLRVTLAQLDEQRAQSLAAADEDTEAKNSAQATAGNEYDDQIAAQEEAAQAAITDYGTLLTQTSQSLADAQMAIDAIATPPAVLDTVSPIVITPGGTPDCSVADIEAAVNGAITQINVILGQILDALNNGNAAQIKDGMTKLQTVGQNFRNAMPAADDMEAQKQGFYDTLEGLA